MRTPCARFSALLCAALLLCLLPAVAVEAAQVYSGLTGFELRTELETYGPGVDRIAVFQENNTSEAIAPEYGWWLDRKVSDGRWKAVRRDSGDLNWSGGYVELRPGESRYEVCDIRLWADRLEPGEYRIRMNVSRLRESGGRTMSTHTVTAPFQVSGSAVIRASLLDRPGLEGWNDVTDWQMARYSLARLYRHPQTGETVLMAEGVKYRLAGQAAKSIDYQVECQRYEGKVWLFYNWLMATEEGYSGYVSAFDLETKHEYTVCGPFPGRHPRMVFEEGVARVSSLRVQREESGEAVYIPEAYLDLGAIRFQNGVPGFVKY